MPLIPTLSPGSAPQVQRAPRVNGPGIRVDLSGVQSAAQDFKRSIGNQPKAPVFDESSGIKAILGSVAGAFQVAGDVALHIQQVNDADHLTQAEMAMEATSKQVRNSIADNPDPSQWETITKDALSKLQENLTGDKLSPMGKKKLGVMMQRFNANLTSDAKYDAIQKVNRNALQTLNLKAQNAINDGDLQKHQEAVQNMVGQGLVPPDTGVEISIDGKRKIDAKVAEDRFQSTLSFIQADPIEAEYLIEDQHKDRPYPDAQKVRLNQAIIVSKNRHRGDTNDSVADGIASGAINSLESLTKIPDWKYLSETDKSQWAKVLTKPPINSNTSYATAVISISQYNAANDKDGSQLANLRTNIAQQFDSGYAQTLKERLDEHLKEDPKTHIPTAGAFSALGEIMKARYNGGKRPVLGANGQPVIQGKINEKGEVSAKETATITFEKVDRAFWNPARWISGDSYTKATKTKSVTPVMEDDYEAMEKASVEAARIMDLAREEMGKENSQIKSEADLFEWISKQTTGSIATQKAASATPVILFPKTAAQLDDAAKLQQILGK